MGTRTPRLDIIAYISASRVWPWDGAWLQCTAEDTAVLHYPDSAYHPAFCRIDTAGMVEVRCPWLVPLADPDVVSLRAGGRLWGNVENKAGIPVAYVVTRPVWSGPPRRPPRPGRVAQGMLSLRVDVTA